MAYYARFPGIYGRYSLRNQALLADSLGCEDGTLFYYNGDDSCYPHLMFINEEDALMYSLKYGAEIFKSVPLKPKSSGD